MRTLHLGDATITRVKVPACSGCSRWGRDFRCHCAGTGFYLECRMCGSEIRDEDGHGYHVQAGSIDCHVCSDTCLGQSVAELVEMGACALRRSA
jgi:hypothetical protein